MRKNIELNVKLDEEEKLFANGVIHEKGEIELAAIIIWDVKNLPPLKNPLTLTTFYQVIQDYMNNHKGKSEIKIEIYDE